MPHTLLLKETTFAELHTITLIMEGAGTRSKGQGGNGFSHPLSTITHTGEKGPDIHLSA